MRQQGVYVGRDVEQVGSVVKEVSSVVEAAVSPVVESPLPLAPRKVARSTRYTVQARSVHGPRSTVHGPTVHGPRSAVYGLRLYVSISSMELITSYYYIVSADWEYRLGVEFVQLTRTTRLGYGRTLTVSPLLSCIILYL
jgi:hypothetical protein